jgi:peroxiredoxin Q/BCP
VATHGAEREKEVMLKEGDKAPDFRVTADNGETVALSDYKGRHVVLYFYPKANTPG